MNHIAYKFELRPSRKQLSDFVNFSGQCRFVFNSLLAASRREKLDLSPYSLGSKVTQLKAECAWLSECDRSCLDLSAKNLSLAYSRFFKWCKARTGRRVGLPRFKSKRSPRSFAYKSRIRVDGSSVFLPKIGWVRFHKSREVIGTVKTASVTQSATGKWFVSIVCEREFEPLPVSGRSVGVDVGLTTFAALSTGEKVSSPRWLVKGSRKLARLQRKLSRAKRGSHNREKARVKAARQHERVANQRRDFQHKLSTRLVNENQVIGVESLDIVGMMAKLGKGFADKGHGEFLRQLEYKSDWYGRSLVKAKRYFPSTKTCHVCKCRTNLKLSDRAWTCKCGQQHDRDVNAALNLEHFAIGHIEKQNASGEFVSLALAS